MRRVATRREFLEDRRHRIRFVYLPKHSSWLNQIEVVFGIVSRKLLRHGSFTSVDDLEDRLRAFLAYFNEVLARPFDWTYTGRPLEKPRRTEYRPPHRRPHGLGRVERAKRALASVVT